MRPPKFKRFVLVTGLFICLLLTLKIWFDRTYEEQGYCIDLSSRIACGARYFVDRSLNPRLLDQLRPLFTQRPLLIYAPDLSLSASTISSRHGYSSRKHLFPRDTLALGSGSHSCSHATRYEGNYADEGDEREEQHSETARDSQLLAAFELAASLWPLGAHVLHPRLPYPTRCTSPNLSPLCTCGASLTDTGSSACSIRTGGRVSGTSTGSRYRLLPVRDHLEPRWRTLERCSRSLDEVEDVGLAQVPRSADAVLLTRPPSANMENFLAHLRRPVVALISFPDMHRWISPLQVLRDGSIVPKLGNPTYRNTSDTVLGALLRQSPNRQHHRHLNLRTAQRGSSGQIWHKVNRPTVLATSELVQRLVREATGVSIGVAPPLALYTSPGGLYSPRPHFMVTVQLENGQQIERVDNECAEDLSFVLVAGDVLVGGRANETASEEWSAEAHEDNQKSRAFRRRWRQEVAEHYAETNARFSLTDIRRQYSRGYSYSEISSHDAIVYIPTQLWSLEFIEHYRMGVPLFVPTLELLLRWQSEYGIIADSSCVELGAQSPSPIRTAAVGELLRITEYYRLPHVVHYASIGELVRLFSSATRARLGSISARMLQHSKHTVEQELSAWRERLVALASHSPRSYFDVASI